MGQDKTFSILIVNNDEFGFINLVAHIGFAHPKSKGNISHLGKRDQQWAQDKASQHKL